MSPLSAAAVGMGDGDWRLGDVGDQSSGLPLVGEDASTSAAAAVEGMDELRRCNGCFLLLLPAVCSEAAAAARSRPSGCVLFFLCLGRREDANWPRDMACVTSEGLLDGVSAAASKAEERLGPGKGRGIASECA